MQSFYWRFYFHIPSFIPYYSQVKIEYQIQQTGHLGKVCFSFYDCQVVMGILPQDEVWHFYPNSFITQQGKCLRSLSGWHIYLNVDYYPPHPDEYWMKQVL